MAKSHYNSEDIKKYMSENHVSRSTAIRHIYKTKAAVAPAKVVDHKMAAANDREATQTTRAYLQATGYVKGNRTRAANTAKKAEATPLLLPKSVARLRRAGGLALYKLAGRPKKSDFIKVYGKRGHLMTWEQRAEAGIPAEKFQAALRKAAR